MWGGFAMNVIAAYVMKKEKMSKEIAQKTAELYLTGMSYEEAFKKAKEYFGLLMKNKC